MAELTVERRAKLQQWLSDAEDALQQLTLGDKTTSFSHGDSASNRSQSFAATDEHTLRRRISELKAELGIADSNSLCPFVPSNF